MLLDGKGPVNPKFGERLTLKIRIFGEHGIALNQRGTSSNLAQLTISPFIVRELWAWMQENDFISIFG